MVLYTIMVVPVKRTDGFITKFNRIIERRLLNYFKNKGYITWEENWLDDTLKCIGCGAPLQSEDKVHLVMFLNITFLERMLFANVVLDWKITMKFKMLEWIVKIFKFIKWTVWPKRHYC